MSAELIRAMNEAVGRGDVEAFVENCHPDAVWEHNPGGGSPEEGTYVGREQIRRHFQRILEGWDYMRLDMTELTETAPGEYVTRGQLHCKHPVTDTEIVLPYEQHLEFRDGLLARARMTFGALVR